MSFVTWDIEATDQLKEWYLALPLSDQIAVDLSVGVLELRGPALGRPHVDHIKRSRHKNMKELRTQSGGKPLRIFFAFDPRRVAILLIAGDKTGDDRFYERMIPQADDLFDEYLREIGETS
ncbi:MAG TPA: type II toxin-antitoxin system RelE/ParE family toxin [Candidatus Baltobacteraceae bacterium]|jgi:hypothetical protein|nr:type II toxin-antitoxin system RelE/ParE family toxin [Candidatus Baltobacteraceae bacterium]